MKKILNKLEKLRQTHLEVEDCWYSCPLCEDGNCRDDNDNICNCGAEEHNKILDEIILIIKEQK